MRVATTHAQCLKRSLWGTNCIALYAGLPSMWGSVDGDQMFSPFYVGGLLIGPQQI